ncbi:MAG: primosomal protein N' [Saprospirales bacterium]|nr:primosomal protein N' [Saprospirales bacterium]
METTSDLFHPDLSTLTFADVLLPIAIAKAYTYIVPEEMVPLLAFGHQVEVSFGKNKRYAGLVIHIHRNVPEAHKPKPILSIIDARPLITPPQLRLWQWMARYYCCTMGEVMNTAVPSNLKLASETRISLSPLYDHSFEGLSDKEFLVTEALSIQGELSLEEVRDILGQKTIYPVIHQLIEKRVIYLKEDIQAKYQPKTIACVRLQEPYASRPELLEEAFELTSRSIKQTEALMGFVQLSRQEPFVRKQALMDLSHAEHGVLKALEKKGIFEIFDQEVSRLPGYEDEAGQQSELSEAQQITLDEIRRQFEERKVVLLHGVTGSGKTRLYVELIQEVIARGGQALYLLPEIALTTQIIDRLKKVFGDKIAVYHSKLNNNERVEVWRAVLEGKPLILGPRSSMFLPFKKLDLIVVDEEHDASYKQQDPAPRYNGRDTAIYMGKVHEARVLLGTATPSLESYHNAKTNKYGLVELFERFGGLELPEVHIADLRNPPPPGGVLPVFSPYLLDELKKTMELKEQAILFQNRRGYAPVYRCSSCGWTQQCEHCDVTLTYHKSQNQLRCHYCGFRASMAPTCPACGNSELRLQGTGTERIEDDLAIYLPEARIGRMDLDTVRTKNAHARIINDFEEHRLDVLVGTQMVTKGLDFDKVSIVGVINADQLLHFPDFRAGERAFQLLTQVAGRAGRKNRRGKVVIQALQTFHPVLKEVLAGDYKEFYRREIEERQEFQYPPFFRLIKITLKHQNPETVNRAALHLGHWLKDRLEKRVIGPAMPYVSRVRGQYLLDILIKLERNTPLINQTKDWVMEGVLEMRKLEGCSGVRANVDVDPV